ncbi:MAG TPA: PhnD/SsuA/transferrin family substrate-binding protein [Candidatus Ozemobacteraceae bacterium]|nr:PhnD/SsuA/transferrin family substrate-binding protein [Candidatus Ozemobacteraceae bacterium]
MMATFHTKHEGGTRRRLCLSVLLIRCLLLLAIAQPVVVSAQDPKLRQLNVGYSSVMISNVDLKDAQIALKVWSDMLERDKKGKWEQQATIYPTTRELIEAYRAGKADIIAFTVLEYLLFKDQVEMTPELVGEISGSPCQQNLLLVNSKSGITSLEQLKGKTLIIENQGTGNIPILWLDIILKKSGLERMRKHFAIVKEVQAPSKAATPVFFQQAHACIVRESGFKTLIDLNPQYQRELTVLASSSAFLRGITCYRRDFDPADKQDLMSSAVKLHETVRGQQILTLFKVDRILPFKPEMLDTAVQLIQEYQKLFPTVAIEP